MTQIIQSHEFLKALREAIDIINAHRGGEKFGCVTGPGRSGAIASAMASHMLGVPFIPYGTKVPDKLHPVLIVDTACQSGRTLRKAARQYARNGVDALVAFAYREPPRVIFWYESQAAT